MSWGKDDILLCRLLFDPEEKDAGELIRLIQELRDWDSFIGKSSAENISPVIYYRLKSLCLDKIIPPAAFRELERLYRINLERNLVILGEAKRVLDRFRAAGIDFILLKGLALAESVYPHFALRQMSDVDILIRKESVSEADGILAGLSYGAVDGRAGDALAGPEGYLSSLEYRKGRSRFLAFHIHWHPVNTTTPAGAFSGRIDLERVWEKAVFARVADVSGKTLHPSHQIIFLCEHALRAGHSFDRLILVYDIHRVILCSKEAIDWRELVAESRSFGLLPLVYAALSVAHHYAPETIPVKVVESARPGTVSPWILFFLILQHRNIRPRGLSVLVYLGMQKGILSKARFLFRLFFPPAAILAHKSFGGRDRKAGIGRYALRFWEITRYFSFALRKLFSSFFSKVF